MKVPSGACAGAGGRQQREGGRQSGHDCQEGAMAGEDAAPSQGWGGVSEGPKGPGAEETPSVAPGTPANLLHHQGPPGPS